MVQQALLLKAAVMRNDAAGSEQYLTYLREHERDSPGTLQDALFHVGRTDEAAQVLIRRLEDPLGRRGALLDVQEYVPLVAPAIVEDENRRREAWLQRPDIKSEIAKVGRRLKVSIPPGLN